MRGGNTFWILVLLALPFATGELLNHTEYHGGEVFTLDEYTFTIQDTYDENFSIRYQEGGRILGEDECIKTYAHSLCLNTSTNTTAKITFYERIRNISIRKTLPANAVVGDEFVVRIRARNDLDKTVYATIKEYTNATVIKQTGWTGPLIWKGYLYPDDERSLSYRVLADRESEYVFNTTALWPGGNSSVEHEIAFTDVLKVTHEYEREPTIGQAYNYTLTITAVNETAVDITILPPEEVLITDYDELVKNGNTLERNADANKSHTFWFTYVPKEHLNTTIDVTITTDDAISSVTRPYTLPIATSPFEPLILVHDHNNTQIPLNESTTLTFTIINPNTEPVTLGWEVASILAEEENSITLPANTTSTREVPVTPTTDNTRYAVRIIMTYDDANNEDIEDIHSVILYTGTGSQEGVYVEQFKPRKQNSTNTSKNTTEEKPPVTAINLIGPDNAREGEEIPFMITMVGVPTQTGKLKIYRDGDIILEENVTVNDSIRLTRKLLGPGIYLAELITDQGSLVAERTVTLHETTPVNTPPPQTPQDDGSAVLIIAFIIISITAGIGFWFAKPYFPPIMPGSRKKRVAAIREEITALEATLNTTPSTTEDFARREETIAKITELEEHAERLEQRKA